MFYGPVLHDGKSNRLMFAHHSTDAEHTDTLVYHWYHDSPITLTTSLAPRPPQILFFGLHSVYNTWSGRVAKSGEDPGTLITWMMLRRWTWGGCGGCKNKQVSYQSSWVLMILWTSGVLPSDEAIDDEVQYVTWMQTPPPLCPPHVHLTLFMW